MSPPASTPWRTASTRCGHPAPTRSARPWPAKESAPSAVDFPPCRPRSAGREQALYGAYLAAVAFASAGSGLHHKICHVLGGIFDLPHAQTHAVVLPHVLAFNAPSRRRPSGASPPRSPLRPLWTAWLGCGRGSTRRAPFATTACPSGIAPAAAAVLAAVPAGNPTPVTLDNLTALLHAAWEGEQHETSAEQSSREAGLVDRVARRPSTTPPTRGCGS